jgi:hypothetical protein
VVKLVEMALLALMVELVPQTRLQVDVVVLQHLVVVDTVVHIINNKVK